MAENSEVDELKASRQSMTNPFDYILNEKQIREMTKYRARWDERTSTESKAANQITEVENMERISEKHDIRAQTERPSIDDVPNLTEENTSVRITGDSIPKEDLVLDTACSSCQNDHRAEDGETMAEKTERLNRHSMDSPFCIMAKGTPLPKTGVRKTSVTSNHSLDSGYASRKGTNTSDYSFIENEEQYTDHGVFY